MGATSGAGSGTAYPSNAPEFTPGISGVGVDQSLAMKWWWDLLCTRPLYLVGFL
jgi:hypothetical protein